MTSTILSDILLKVLWLSLNLHIENENIEKRKLSILKRIEEIVVATEFRLLHPTHPESRSSNSFSTPKQDSRSEQSQPALELIER
jgi:hypothetical protein